MSYKNGDIIVLKSGSPQMTVTTPPYNSADDIPYLKAKWFDSTAQSFKEEYLPVDSVEKAAASK